MLIRGYKLILVLFLGAFYSYGQYTEEQLETLLSSSNEKKLIEENTELSLAGIYYQAGRVADKLLEFDAENANYNYRKGYALIHSTVDYTKSIGYLEIASKNINKNYDLYSTKEKGAPVDAIMYLAYAYHLKHKFDKAIENYQLFLEKAPKKADSRKLVELKLKQCYVAKELVKDPKPFEIQNVGSVINTENPEYSPVVSLDGSALYFTTRRLRLDKSNEDIKEDATNMHLEDIYVSYKDFDGEWTEPVLLDFCLPERNEATVAISKDERKIYTYIGEDNGGNIYASEFIENTFQDLEKLDYEGVNSDAWEPHINVSPDGRSLFFVSDREGGFGGRDIYEMTKMPDGSWSEPKNLGPTVNTPYDEDAPFVAVDNKTLYFSSNGEKSMGGFDVFMVQRDETGNWGEPENLGVPINTAGDDIYYTTTMDGFTGYLSSFREDGKGEKDIYKIKNTHLGMDNLVALKGEIETTDGSKIPNDMAYTLKCLNCDEKYEVDLFPRINDGTFYANLEPCKTYEVSFHYENGEKDIYQETFSSGGCDGDYEEVYKHFLLDKDKMEFVDPKDEIESFQPLAFTHYFGYNKNSLDTEKGELNKFVKAVENQIEKGREDIVIKIHSSSSKVPTKSFKSNKELAQSRAENIKSNLNVYFDNLEIQLEISIEEVGVNGPEYKRGDAKNIEKYAPFQFVKLKVDGYNTVDDSETLLKSKDNELESKTDLNAESVVSTSILPPSQNFESGKSNANDYDYHIVVGAFKNVRYAEGLVKKLKKNGFENTSIIGERKGLKVVSAYSSSKYSEVEGMLKNIRENVNNSAWILNTGKTPLD